MLPKLAASQSLHLALFKLIIAGGRQILAKVVIVHATKVELSFLTRPLHCNQLFGLIRHGRLLFCHSLPGHFPFRVFAFAYKNTRGVEVIVHTIASVVISVIARRHFSAAGPFDHLVLPLFLRSTVWLDLDLLELIVELNFVVRVRLSFNRLINNLIFRLNMLLLLSRSVHSFNRKESACNLLDNLVAWSGLLNPDSPRLLTLLLVSLHDLRGIGLFGGLLHHLPLLLVLQLVVHELVILFFQKVLVLPLEVVQDFYFVGFAFEF